MNSIVFAPPFQYGGVKSLYSVCEWLKDVGRSTIRPFGAPTLATWFGHDCELYDYSYSPDLLVYPEVYQPHVSGARYHICFALGKRGQVEPYADLTVCRSREILDWVKKQHPQMPAVLILPSIDRSVFEYDGRPKKDTICYMTRPDKHPETARLLRNQYDNKVLEIVDFSQADVAEALKDSKVFVWRGNDSEGSPRPPKEALVAGCIVVGLETDLKEDYHINFGVRCSTVDELIQMAGEGLKMPVPADAERSVVRDSQDEKEDWIALFKQLEIRRPRSVNFSIPLSVNSLSAQEIIDGKEWTRDLLAAEAVEKDKMILQAFEQQKKMDPLVALVAERQRAVESLAAQLTEQQKKMDPLVALVAERQSAVESLAAQLTEQQKKMDPLVALVAERQSAVDSLAAQLAEQQKKVDSLVALVTERQSAVDSLAEQLTERHEKVLALTDHVAERQRVVESLTSQLAEAREKLAECMVHSRITEPVANN